MRFWPSYFFCVFIEQDELEVGKKAIKDEANIQPS